MPPQRGFIWQFSSRFLLAATTVFAAYFSLVRVSDPLSALIVLVFSVWLLMPIWLPFVVMYCELTGGPVSARSTDEQDPGKER